MKRFYTYKGFVVDPWKREFRYCSYKNWFSEIISFDCERGQKMLEKVAIHLVRFASKIHKKEKIKWEQKAVSNEELLLMYLHHTRNLAW